MKGAKFLIVPSVCYENFPRIVSEAYTYGIPVLASSLGSLPEVIKDKETGLLFEPGSSEDLIKKVNWFLDHEDQIPFIKANILRRQQEDYSKEKNYEILMHVYDAVIRNYRKNRFGSKETNIEIS